MPSLKGHDEEEGKPTWGGGIRRRRTRTLERNTGQERKGRTRKSIKRDLEDKNLSRLHLGKERQGESGTKLASKETSPLILSLRGLGH